MEGLRIKIKRVDPEEIIRKIIGNVPYTIRKAGDEIEITIEDKHVHLKKFEDRTTLRERIKRKLPRGWKVTVEG